MDVSNFRIVALRGDQVSGVVRLHGAAFPGFFLTFLGPSFLAEFYGSFLDDPVGIAFTAVDANDGLLGVVAGPVMPDGYFRRLLARRWLALALASLGAVSQKPAIAPRLFRALRYRGEPPPGPVRALLSSLAVAPECQGRGVGAALVGRWVGEVRGRGAPGCFLTTDAVGNEGINRFYVRLGWRIESSFTTSEGRTMNRYVLDFPAAATDVARQPA